jgi:hypothetical protein|tara:strand:+ start:421 stop:666 length:246 start_codon:yes stop_codon:yes gene_type:complete
MSERQLPFKVDVLLKEPKKITNPFSGESYTLEPDAVAVYDVIWGEQLAEAQGLAKCNWDNVRKGLDWFREYEPKAYMVLLD